MRRIAIALGFAFALFGVNPSAVAQSGTQPFKLGTFERQGQVLLGVVLSDTQVIDLAKANAALESRDSTAKRLVMPGDMKELIGRYETELAGRLSALASEVAAAGTMPAYVYRITDLKTLPPVRPAIILNGGGNYREHEQGIAQQQQRAGGGAREQAPPAVSAPGIWERKPGDTRENPYLFLKSPT